MEASKNQEKEEGGRATVRIEWHFIATENEKNKRKFSECWIPTWKSESESGMGFEKEENVACIKGNELNIGNIKFFLKKNKYGK